MVVACCVRAGAAAEPGTVGVLAAHIYKGMLMVLPASVHIWFSDLRDRSRSQAVEAYTASRESPTLLKHEMSVLQVRWLTGCLMRSSTWSVSRQHHVTISCHMFAQVGGEHTSETFGIRANAVSREVVASMTIEEGAVLELAIKLPPSWPLRVADIECRRKVLSPYMHTMRS